MMAAVLAAMLPATARAHVTLETRTAEAGSAYKAVFKVGHGCDGSPIRELIVEIPDGVVGARPMPKAGWTLDIRREALPAPYDSHGKRIADAPRRIRWTGGPLPDAHYDEFVLVARLPEQPGRLYWKVSQVCEQGRIDWVETPEPGRRSAFPAAVLDVVAPPAGGDAHRH